MSRSHFHNDTGKGIMVYHKEPLLTSVSQYVPKY